jgi:RNA polymerase sigma-70 factor, ECF subfamily
VTGDRRRLRAVAGGEPRRRTDDLLAAVATGDQAAFGQLYDQLARSVHGVVRTVVKDPELSDEVTQEVLVEVWRTAARFDPARGSARTWIMTMAHRRAIDRVRSEQSSRERTQRIGHRERDVDVDDVSERVLLAEEHALVRAALAGLTDVQRQAVELAYFQGHTYREVAELLQTPLGTIKTRMRNGLLRLRNAMEVTQ